MSVTPKEPKDKQGSVENWSEERLEELRRVNDMISDKDVSDEEVDRARKEYLDKYYE